jgi:3-methyladenine DNA glycosylase AlkD
MNLSAKYIIENLQKLKDEKRSKTNAWFFKDYKYLGKKNGGDKFLGVRVPNIRSVVKDFYKQTFLNYKNLKVIEIKKLQKDLQLVIQELFDSHYHEVRIAGAMLIHMSYMKAIKEKNVALMKELFRLYNKNVGWNKGINNWDLVDETARDIAGHYVAEIMSHEERLSWIDKSIASKDLWVNRVVIVATWWEIKKGNEKMCFYVVERSLGHTHDLIHKACGWMLREVGRCCSKDMLAKFIHAHVHHMPRTCLRYAIEHFPKYDRDAFLRL